MRLFLFVTAAACTLFSGSGCSPAPDSQESPAPDPMVSTQQFGTTFSGEEVTLFTLKNAAGMEVDVMSYGAILVAIRVPDRNGDFADVLLGFDSLDNYLQRHPRFGSVIGRYGNRISRAQFEIDGEVFTLARNNGENHIHGGLVGFDQVMWDARMVADDGKAGVVLSYTSADGEEGYPGEMPVSVTYMLDAENALSVTYHATTDRATHINMTQHAYFNLAGEGSGSVAQQVMEISAEAFTPVREGSIPTGEIRSVADTPFDFREPHSIGERIDAIYDQLTMSGGYDHNFIVDGEQGNMRMAARAVDPGSGRFMEVLTTEPGVQFYTANNLSGVTGKGGHVYGPRSGFCLETQHYPDTPNRPEFPTTLLRPGEEYMSSTVFRFGTE